MEPEDNDYDVDNDILSNVEGLEDLDSNEQTDGEAETSTDNAETGSETLTLNANDKQGTDKSTTTEPERKTNSPQDLVDAQGNVLATGGRERRFYETAQREKQRAENATRELESVKSQLTAIKEAGTVGSQYELSPEEVTVGAQLISAYKNNPVEAIKYMLTQAQSNGHDVSDLVGGGTNMTAIKQMIENAIAPLTQDKQQQMVTQENENKARNIYNDFISKYPDSAVHEDSLARLIQQDPSMSLDAAYYRLQSYYAQRGLDWTKSLAKLQEETNQQPSSVPNTQPQPPEGRTSSNNVTDTSRVADVSTSTDDIIRQAMQEAGIN